MKTIRHSVFETNSSSTHSITIRRSFRESQYMWDFSSDEPDTIVIVGGGFGWENDTFNDAPRKASYAVAEYKENADMLEKIKDVVESRTGKKVIISVSKHDTYIDHQSQGDLTQFLSEGETLENYIFDPRIHVETGNDNE